MVVSDVVQGTYDWLLLRKGKITGSRLKDVFKSNNLTLVDELIAELGTDEVEETYVNEAMARGNELEPIARAEYEKLKSCTVDEVGFCIHEELDWLGVSPDGLIETDGRYTKGLEIKCPSTKTHIRYIRENKIPNEYKYQIYLYFLIVDSLEELDFMSYDDRYKPQSVHIVNIKRKDIETELEECMKGILKFREKFNKYYEQIIF